jgi:hypothetical protein
MTIMHNFHLDSYCNYVQSGLVAIGSVTGTEDLGFKCLQGVRCFYFKHSNAILCNLIRIVIVHI